MPLLTSASEQEPLGDQIVDELAEQTYTVELLDRWFREARGQWSLDQQVREMVTFHHH